MTRNPYISTHFGSTLDLCNGGRGGSSADDYDATTGFSRFPQSKHLTTSVFKPSRPSAVAKAEEPAARTPPDGIFALRQRYIMNCFPSRPATPLSTSLSGLPPLTPPAGIPGGRSRAVGDSSARPTHRALVDEESAADPRKGGRGGAPRSPPSPLRWSATAGAGGTRGGEHAPPVRAERQTGLPAGSASGEEPPGSWEVSPQTASPAAESPLWAANGGPSTRPETPAPPLPSAAGGEGLDGCLARSRAALVRADVLLATSSVGVAPNRPLAAPPPLPASPPHSAAPVDEPAALPPARARVPDDDFSQYLSPSSEGGPGVFPIGCGRRDRAVGGLALDASAMADVVSEEWRVVAALCVGPVRQAVRSLARRRRQPPLREDGPPAGEVAPPSHTAGSVVAERGRAMAAPSGAPQAGRHKDDGNDNDKDNDDDEYHHPHRERHRRHPQRRHGRRTPSRHGPAEAGSAQALRALREELLELLRGGGIPRQGIEAERPHAARTAATASAATAGGGPRGSGPLPAPVVLAGRQPPAGQLLSRAARERSSTSSGTPSYAQPTVSWLHKNVEEAEEWV